MENKQKKQKTKRKLMIPILTIMAIALVSAVGYYAMASVNIHINQPISISGNVEQSIDCDAGETCIGSSISVSNSGDEPKTITITDNSDELIEVDYLGKVELENKDSNYEVIEDDKKADFYYSITGEEMKYKLEAEGLDDIEYALIYYADDQDRFNVWGGSPAVLIGSGTASSGELSLEGNVDIGNIPFDTDWNTDGEPNYCDLNNGYDDYEHCYGAKIWLVRMSDYNEAEQTVYPNWYPNEWLFETDLIYYFDNSNNEYTIGSGSFVEFYPLFTADEHLPEGDYQIDIQVQ